MDEYKDVMSFVIEKNEDGTYLSEVAFYTGETKNLEAPSMSGNIFVNDKVVAGFDNPVVFEVYFNERNIERVVCDRSTRDDSVYFDIYLKA